MKRENLLFYAGVLPALFFQAIGAYLYFVVFPEGKNAQALYAGTKIFILLWPLLWMFVLVRGTKLPFLGEKTEWDAMRSVQRGLVFGFLTLGFILLIFSNFEDYFAGFAPQIAEKVNALGIAQHYIFFAIFLSFIHAALEEYYWRWFVFRGLLVKCKPTPAAFIGSMAFASHHYIILSQFFPLWLTLIFGTAVGIGGIIWCFIYAHTRSLWGPYLSHVIIDLTIMAIGYVLIF